MHLTVGFPASIKSLIAQIVQSIIKGLMTAFFGSANMFIVFPGDIASGTIIMLLRAKKYEMKKKTIALEKKQQLTAD